MRLFETSRFQEIWSIGLIMVISFFAQHAYAAWEPQTDRPGMDYKVFSIDNSVEGFVAVKKCEDACKNEPQCKAFTYVNPGVQGPHSRCWLKNGVPAKMSKDGCTSGVVRPDSKGDYCNNYALDAVQMAKNNDGWKCGYSGGRWNLDYKNHFTWCMQVPKTRTLSEAKARKNGMTQCMQPSTKGDLAAHDWCYRLDKNSGKLSFAPVIKNEGITTWKSAKEGEYRVGVSVGSLISEYKYTLRTFPNWYLNSKDISILPGPTVSYHPNNMYGIKHLWMFSHPEDSPISNNSSEGMGGYFKGISFENDPLILVNQCKDFKSIDVLTKPGTSKKLAVQVILRSIEVVDEADGSGNAEPYLWPFFFQIDYRMILPDHFYNPPKWSHAPGGEHGNIGDNYDAGQMRLIPIKYGHWKTTFEQNPIYPKDNAFIGAVVVLLEEDDAPSSNDVINKYYPEFQSKIAKTIQCQFLKAMKKEVDYLTAKGDSKAGMTKLFYDQLIMDQRLQNLDCPSSDPSSSGGSGSGAQEFSGFIKKAEQELRDEILSNLQEPWWAWIFPPVAAFLNIDDFIGGEIVTWKWTDLEKNPYRSLLFKWNNGTKSEDGDFNLRMHLRAKPIY